MIFQEDLAEALYRKDNGAIEAAFSARIGCPADVEEPGTALLVECCRGLADDEHSLPPEIVDAINGIMGAEDIEPLPHGSTFSSGAARVWRGIARFAPLFGEALEG